MVFKKLHLGEMSFSQDTLKDIGEYLISAYKGKKLKPNSPKCI